MTIKYCEEYRIARLRIGIEDYDAPGQHFFSNHPHKRFKCWVTGCGICKGHDTIEEARGHVMEYALERLSGEVVTLQTRLFEVQDAVVVLERLTYGDLEGFKVEGPHNE